MDPSIRPGIAAKVPSERRGEGRSDSLIPTRRTMLDGRYSMWM